MSRSRPGTIREALEETLRNNPDDLVAHAAYADLLTEEGDPPRGEFMQVQLALEDEPLSQQQRKRLADRERELLAAHERNWLGPLGPIVLDQSACDECQLEDSEFENKPLWRRGLLSGLHLGWCPDEVAEALCESTERLSFLRELRIVHVPTDDYGVTSAFDSLREWPIWQQIHVFQLGSFVNEDYDEYIGFSSRVDGDECNWIVDQMGEVEELYLFARGLRPDFSLPKPRLRILQYYHGSYGNKVGRTLGSNPSLGNLTHLLIHPHESDPEVWPFELEDLEALVHSPHLPRLTHLRLRLHNLGDRACTVLTESGILGRLRTLDLRHGVITDVGARILAACPDLIHLELLDVSRNALTDAGITALKQTGIQVEASFQGTLEGGYHDYLYQGDQE